MHPAPVEITISNEAIEWFSRFHSGQATPEDRSRFENWRRQSPLHAKAYADVEKFWALLDEPARRVLEQEEAQTCDPMISAPSRCWVTPFFAGRWVPRTLWGFSLAAATVAIFLCLPHVLCFCSSNYYHHGGEQILNGAFSLSHPCNILAAFEKTLGLSSLHFPSILASCVEP